VGQGGRRLVVSAPAVWEVDGSRRLQLTCGLRPQLTAFGC